MQQWVSSPEVIRPYQTWFILHVCSPYGYPCQRSRCKSVQSMLLLDASIHPYGSLLKRIYIAFRSRTNQEMIDFPPRELPLELFSLALVVWRTGHTVHHQAIQASIEEFTRYIRGSDISTCMYCYEISPCFADIKPFHCPHVLHVILWLAFLWWVQLCCQEWRFNWKVRRERPERLWGGIRYVARKSCGLIHVYVVDSPIARNHCSWLAMIALFYGVLKKTIERCHERLHRDVKQAYRHWRRIRKTTTTKTPQHELPSYSTFSRRPATVTSQGGEVFGARALPCQSISIAPR